MAKIEITPISEVEKAYIYRTQALWYLKQWVGTPYCWGGDDFSSMDCSGLIVEDFKAIGKFGEREDYTADGLYHLFKAGELEEGKEPYEGCLVFWFNPLTERATHVAMMIDNYFLIHASGGGSGTKTMADAIRSNAFIKMRELEKVASFRKKEYAQYYKVVDPFKQ